MHSGEIELVKRERKWVIVNTAPAQKQRRFGNLVKMLLLLALALVASDSPAGCAQEPRQPARSSIQSPSDSGSPSMLVLSGEDHRLGPGDVIEVQIEDAPELSGTFRVNAAGAIPMHYLGRITAQQKTTEELANFIADGLRGRYLSNPHVTVMLKQVNRNSFFIQGAVRSPGVYQIAGRLSLLKLLTVAGGLADNHGSTAFIIRELKTMGAAGQRDAADARQGGTSAASPGSQPSEAQPEEEGQYELKRVNINGLLKGRFDENLVVEPGDIINIPPADVFFVAGEVKAPGSFTLKEGTTLRQAISLAQGTTIKAATGRGIIFREDPITGQRQEMKVNIDAVMSGRQPDLAILANDVIIVPNSRAKSIGSAFLTAFGLNAARLPVRY
jgi:polysaccharide export outer membrane protein